MSEEKRGFTFADDLAPLILDGSKTFTYRPGDRYDYLRAGDVCRIVNTSTHTPFAEIEILDKTSAQFADLPINREGHEPYPSKEVMRRVFESYYNRPIADDETMQVFQFKLLRRLKTR